MPNECRLAVNKAAGLQFLNYQAGIIENIEPVIQIGCPTIRLDGEDDLCNDFVRCKAVCRNSHVEANVRVAWLQRLTNKKLGQLRIKRAIVDSCGIVIEGDLDIAIAADQLSKRLIILEMYAAKRRLDLRLVLRQGLTGYIEGQGEAGGLVSGRHRKRRRFAGTAGIEEQLVLLKRHIDKAFINRGDVDLDLADQRIRIKAVAIDCGGYCIRFGLVE